MLDDLQRRLITGAVSGLTPPATRRVALCVIGQGWPVLRSNILISCPLCSHSAGQPPPEPRSLAGAAISGAAGAG